MNFQQLSAREKRLVLLTGAVVLVVALWRGLIVPYQEASSLLDTKIASRTRQLSEIRQLQQEYRLLQRQLSEAERQVNQEGRTFSLFSFIEGLTVQAGLKDNLLSMRPQTPAVEGDFRQESVEVKLEKIGLEQLVRFLYAIEHADVYLQIKNLRAKPRFDNRALLDTTLSIAYYERAQ